MTKQVLTDRAIQGLRCTGTRYEIADPSFRPGSLVVRVGADGAKSFCLRYRPRDSKRQRRKLIGSYPELSLADARRTAREIMAQVSLGTDPELVRQTKRGAGTFGDLVRLYMSDVKETKRSWKYIQGICDRELARWKSRPMDGITRADVLLLHKDIRGRGSPVMANRTVTALSGLFNWAIDHELISANPAARLGRHVRAKETPRNRWLNNPDEIRKLWSAMESQPPVVEAVFKLRLLTGQRGVEIRHMRWGDIQGDVWTIPSTVAKNGKEHRAPLSRQAMAIIEGMRPYTGDCRYVFPSRRSGDAPIGTLNKAFERIKTLSGVACTPHDLRRTAASHMAEMGVSHEVIGRILNHAERGVTATVYVQASFDKAKRIALQRWADRIDAILHHDHENIVAWPAQQVGEP